MDYEKLKTILNPYSPRKSKLSPKEFIGRIDEINLLCKILVDYQKTASLKNILITGEKSTGKSSLLHRYQQLLEDHNFIVYYEELHRDEDLIDEFEFFKSIFDFLFRNYAASGIFLDQQQAEIWYSLTQGDYQHRESNYLDRKISFATIYANKKLGYNEKLSYQIIEEDFKVIENSLISQENEIVGLALLIDEFQILQKNPIIIEYLRKLSDNLSSLIIICAGFELDNKIGAVEKFYRNSDARELKNLSNNEIQDIIFNPIERITNCSRHEIQKLFDPKSLHEIISRSGGNPLHIKVLCEKMFHSFQYNSNQKELKLSTEIMEDVMEFYAGISEESKKIKNVFKTAKPEQIEAFAKLFFFDRLSIKAAIIYEMAFNNYSKENESIEQKKIFELIEEVFDLGLFHFGNSSISLTDLIETNVDRLAQVEIRYIGDAIDRLYTQYMYEKLTEKKLVYNDTESFEELLALKLTDNLSLANVSEQIHENIKGRFLLQIKKISDLDTNKCEDIVNDYDRLIKHADKENINETVEKEIKDDVGKLGLFFPSHLASFLDFEGYLVLLVSVSIKGKKMLLQVYFPIQNTINWQSIRQKINDYSKVINASLEDYYIKINWMYLYSIPKNPLTKIYYIQLGDIFGKLLKKVQNRDFNEAVKIANAIFELNLRFVKENLYAGVQSTNDYAFCLINVGDLTEAEKLLRESENRYIISKLNLSYIFTCTDRLDQGIKILKKLVNKQSSNDDKVSFIHLAINHPNVHVNFRIIEDAFIWNVINWNLALISSQKKCEPSIINQFVKKVRMIDKDIIIHQRVLCWIDYYLNRLDKSIERAEILLSKCKSIDYLRTAVENDISIFREEIYRT